MKDIILTQNFKSSMGDMLGKIEIADNENAKAVFELLKEHPDWFSFEIGYTVQKNGKKELTEISIVSKHVKQ